MDKGGVAVNLLQYIEFKINEAIEMLMNEDKSKIECALFLMEFKKILREPKKEIIDGEVTVIDEIKCIGDAHGID